MPETKAMSLLDVVLGIAVFGAVLVAGTWLWHYYRDRVPPAPPDTGAP